MYKQKNWSIIHKSVQSFTQQRRKKNHPPYGDHLKIGNDCKILPKGAQEPVKERTGRH